MCFEIAEVDSISAVKSGIYFLSTGVGTQTITISEFAMHSAGFEVAFIFPFRFFNLSIRYSSSIGLRPLLTLSILCLSISNPKTLYPFPAQRHAKGKPTYPRPTTVMVFMVGKNPVSFINVMVGIYLNNKKQMQFPSRKICV